MLPVTIVLNEAKRCFAALLHLAPTLTQAHSIYMQCDCAALLICHGMGVAQARVELAYVQQAEKHPYEAI